MVAGQPYDRSSDFFEKNIRDYEYMAVVDLALEALDYDDTVLINAPFTREVRDLGYMSDLKAKLDKKGAILTVIWVKTDPEVCHQRMIARNSSRDWWKLQHWDEYIAGINFNIPQELNDTDRSDDLLIFENSSDAEYQASMKRMIDILGTHE